MFRPLQLDLVDRAVSTFDGGYQLTSLAYATTSRRLRVMQRPGFDFLNAVHPYRLGSDGRVPKLENERQCSVRSFEFVLTVGEPFGNGIVVVIVRDRLGLIVHGFSPIIIGQSNTRRNP
jgi:hypothetical protein